MQDHKLHSPHGRAPTTTGLRRGRNSHAPHGNFLEAINLALDVFDEEHIERNPPGRVWLPRLRVHFADRQARRVIVRARPP